jgi:hypothetical protein
MTTLELILPLFDTLHDFWKERKLAKNDEEDEDNELMDEDKLITMRNLLVDRLYQTTGNQLVSADPNTNINNLLKKMSGNRISSATSNYERTVEKFYEAQSPELFADTKERITYGDIIKSYAQNSANPSIKQKFMNSIGSNCILEISPGDDNDFPSFGMVQRNPTYMSYVANFILEYFQSTITSKAYQAFFTFDAKPGIVGKTFRDIEESFQLVTPANIADSAITTFKALKNRNEYQFLTNGAIADQFLFSSNAFTREVARISFANRGFNSKNPFGFNLQIDSARGNLTFPFSSSQKQGPSVNYLVDLMVDVVRGTVGSAAPNISTILNMNNINAAPELIQAGILFDLKRGGDYEQVNLAKGLSDSRFVIFSTIDILCALFSRIQKQNTILHVNETMTLYRFPTTGIDPVIMEFQQVKYKSGKLVQNLEIIKKVIESGMFTDIAEFVEKIKTYLQSGFFIDMSNRKSERNTSESITNKVIKSRLLDIYPVLFNLNGNCQQYITLLESQGGDTTTLLSNITEDVTILKQMVSYEGPPIDYSEITRIIEKYNAVSTQELIIWLQESFDLTPNQIKMIQDNGENPLGLNYEFYTTIPSNTGTPIPKFKYSGNYTQLNFSNKLYSTLFDVINKFERMVNSTSSRGSKNLYKKLQDMGYFTLVINIYNSYVDKTIAEAVNNALMPEATDDDSVAAWFGALLTNLNTILTPNAQTFFGPTFIMTGGNSDKIKHKPILSGKKYLGGTADLLQCQHLSDLLRLISGTAAQFIESFISENVDATQAPVQITSPSTLMIALTAQLPLCIETMENIRFLLSDGLMSIQNNIDEAYEYKPTTSEIYLLFILSLVSTYDAANSFVGNVTDNFYVEAYSVHDDATTREVTRMSTQMNDIAALYMTSKYPAEIINLLLLTLFDNVMQQLPAGPLTPKDSYFSNIISKTKRISNAFDNDATWGRIPNYAFSYVTYITTDKQLTREQRSLLSGGGNKSRKIKKRTDKTSRMITRIKRKRSLFYRKHKQTRKYKNTDLRTNERRMVTGAMSKN